MLRANNESFFIEKKGREMSSMTELPASESVRSHMQKLF